MTETTTNAAGTEVVATIKGGTGFDAPWIVVHGPDAADVTAQLKDEAMKELVEQSAAVARAFIKEVGKGKPAAAAPASNGQPAESKQPPAGAPECPEGWTYREGVSKAGNAYKGFFPPRGDDSKPIFFK